MTQSHLIYPAYFRVVRREGNTWYFRQTELFYRAEAAPPVDFASLEAEYGLTKSEVAIELFRINGGKAGYYLANLRDKHYHYCGLEFSNIKTTLFSLGIGRLDPQEPNRS